MRNTFVNELLLQAKSNKKIFLITGDVGFSVLEPFKEKYPDRFLNAGISEQNMILTACGLASEGYNVFVYSIGNFPIFRCYEQIRNYVAYPKANVKIISTGSGFSYGPLGVSHHTTEDISALRVLPNLTIMSPADPLEAKASAKYLSRYIGPAYIRVAKSGDPIIHKKDLLFKNIEPICVKKTNKSKIAVLTTGNILNSLLDEANNNYDLDFYSFPFVKPLPINFLKKLFLKYKFIITAEEHQLAGGFGSSIIEIHNDQKNKNGFSNSIFRIGIKDKFFSITGSQKYIMKKNNLNLNHIMRLIDSNR